MGAPAITTSARLEDVKPEAARAKLTSPRPMASRNLEVDLIEPTKSGWSCKTWHELFAASRTRPIHEIAVTIRSACMADSSGKRIRKHPLLRTRFIGVAT